MIHPSAIVHPGAKIGGGVAIGPYSIIGEHVEIGAGTRIGPHVVIEGRTRIGCDNNIFQFCSLGGAPQDKKYNGEPTRLEIGDRNTIREYCCFSIGTSQDAGVTRVGDDNWIMAYVHIAHDCQVGSHTIFANNATIAGHVQVGDWAILGGFTGVHQFVRVGAHSFCGVNSVLLQDLPPYVTVAGNPAAPHGINSEGLRRRAFTAAAISAIKDAYRALYRSGLALAEARERIAAIAAAHTEVQPFADFIGIPGRGLARPRRKPSDAGDEE
ncbi:MAG: acyl-ACP--UDP-N-acetylglucosamine O-acyltransferase [Azoarcus sp.]|jgi:UDP-N-acetylglucosamine acyltransferase|nr:acyl-ACP--UDP-N-acetylglucosamine O-acyltransferase [Azoarcus sp.]